MIKILLTYLCIEIINVSIGMFIPVHVQHSAA